uniref:Putative secreted protein n=1 Tax=Amblyomma americanum TaxID=6943 RepID=A0A0C9R3U5_AMBAM
MHSKRKLPAFLALSCAHLLPRNGSLEESMPMSHIAPAKSTDFGGAVWSAPQSSLGSDCSQSAIGRSDPQSQSAFGIHLPPNKQKNLTPKCSESVTGIQHK